MRFGYAEGAWPVGGRAGAGGYRVFRKLAPGSKAEVLWKEALAKPGFARQVDALTMVIVPDFGMAASQFLMRLGDNQISFVIDLNEGYSVEEFVVMAKMGFFEYRGTGYHFAIPADLDSSTVRAAALSFAQTEDEDYGLHPTCGLLDATFKCATVPMAASCPL